MKRLLVVALTMAVALALVLAGWWLLAARSLPPLESEFDLQRFFRDRIEGERRARFPVMNEPQKAAIAFRTPDLTNYPSEAVGLFMASLECPRYLQSPREPDREWTIRLARLQFLKAEDPPSSEACDLQLARHVVWNLGIRAGGLRETIAIDRIRSLLPKGKLAAYAMATEHYSAGVIGVEGAAEALYHRAMQQMTLDELAQLTLVLPPVDAYDELAECTNLSTIRLARDAVLIRAANEALVPMDKAKAARGQPVLCSR